MTNHEFLFPPIKYSAFTQAVRRYRPRQLIPVLARMSARLDPNFRGIQEVQRFPPWAASAIARESIVRGNEHRSEDASEVDIRRLIRMHTESFVEPRVTTINSLVGPLFHEQFWWQQSLFEELCRAICVFELEQYGEKLDWRDVFGMTLADAIRASFMVGVVVNTNGGRWEPGLLDRIYAGPRATSLVARSSVEEIARRLTIGLEECRAIGQIWDTREHRDPDLVRYPLNPLVATPLVDLGSDDVWAPVGSLVWRALLPNVLYSRGRDKWGSKFTAALGKRYENYVGALLCNIVSDLQPEISYGKGGGQRSVDWIWVGKDVVVLVECKSAGLSLDSIAGGGRFEELLENSIGKGKRQIDRTAELIRQQAPGFRDIPHDRRIVGLVVTSDPFFLANTGLQGFGASNQVPTMVASVRSIEHFTTVPDAERALMDIFDDPHKMTLDFEQAIAGLPTSRHPVAAAVWHEIAVLKDFLD